MLTEGNKAPAFELPGDDGKIHTLSQNLGKWVVLYFYPQDLTPGCTTEACEFNAALDDLLRKNAVVLGISKDTLVSHTRFRGKHDLRFSLLSDVDLAVHKVYGAYGEKNNYGKVSLGTIRSTFLIDKKGNIAKIWSKVRVKDHVKSVLDTLEKLSEKEAGFMSKSVRVGGK